MITYSTDAAMKARLIRIGNSRGIRIPKALIEAAGLTDAVELEVRGGALTIRAVRGVREGWAEAAREAALLEGTGLLDEPTPTRFDDEEWEW